MAPQFSNSAVPIRELSASGPFRFTPGKGASGTQCKGGWVDTRARLDPVE
jgi:hypothetical protein